MAHCTPHRVGEASATELGTQNAPGKAPVRAQRRIIKYILNPSYYTVVGKIRMSRKNIRVGKYKLGSVG